LNSTVKVSVLSCYINGLGLAVQIVQILL